MQASRMRGRMPANKSKIKRMRKGRKMNSSNRRNRRNREDRENRRKNRGSKSMSLTSCIIKINKISDCLFLPCRYFLASSPEFFVSVLLLTSAWSC
jgi:hypothetical protein